MTYPQQVALVNEEFFKKMSPVKGQVDPNLIWPAMYVAQDKYLAPYLGDALYEKLVTDAPTFAGEYLTLMQKHVVYVVVWGTLLELLPTLQYQYANGTLSQHNSEDATPVDDGIMKDMLDRTRTNLHMYTCRMLDYFCDYSSLIPEYSSNTGSQRCPLKTVPKTSSYVISDGVSDRYHSHNFRRYGFL